LTFSYNIISTNGGDIGKITHSSLLETKNINILTPKVFLAVDNKCGIIGGRPGLMCRPGVKYCC
jgi:hypothetical protein